MATRIFDAVVRDDKMSAVKDRLNLDQESISYWRRVLRVAALCHDTGHLPFSHAAESALLPPDWNHERITKALILDGPLTKQIKSMSPPILPQDVAKVAISPGELTPEEAESLTDWEAIVAEILTGQVFGADRMDYLLRDSHHTGVAYGRFDQHRLIDTIGILAVPPSAPSDDDAEPPSTELTLGVEAGGLQTAESLLLARYFMFKQVYFHHVRRIYDLHLMDFLKSWLPNGRFDVDPESHLALSDPKVTAAIQDVSLDTEHPAHDAARRLLTRQHFRRVYSPLPAHSDICADPGAAVFRALCDEFGSDNLKHDVNYDRGIINDFPVLSKQDDVTSALSVSEVLQQHLPMSFDVVFVAPEMAHHVREYLTMNTERILEEHPSTEDAE